MNDYFSSAQEVLEGLNQVLTCECFNEDEVKQIKEAFLNEVNYNDEQMPLMIINQSLMKVADVIDAKKLAYIHEKLSKINRY